MLAIECAVPGPLFAANALTHGGVRRKQCLLVCTQGATVAQPLRMRPSGQGLLKALGGTGTAGNLVQRPVVALVERNIRPCGLLHHPTGSSWPKWVDEGASIP